MRGAQVLMIILMSSAVALNLAKDGEPRKDNDYSFAVSLISNLILAAILWWGGFWK